MFPSYTEKILAIYHDAGFNAYVVGGAARDIIMGKTPHDYDVATDASPDEGLRLLAIEGVKTIDTSKKHGTIVAVLMGEQIEITTFRVDGDYEDNRHPTNVKLTRNIEEDVARRDFTMNAIYIDKDGKYTDLFGGVSDIENKIIRTVGDPHKRFTEDALRILRALRFSAVLGFTIEEETSKTIFELKDLLMNISCERINEELCKLIVGKHASSVIREYLEVFSLFIPELLRMRGFDQHSRYHDRDLLEHTLSVLDGLPEDKDANLGLAALLHDTGKPDVFVMDEDGYGHMKKHNLESVKIATRFLEAYKFSNADKKEIEDLVLLHDSFPEKKASLRRYMSEYSLEFFKRLSLLQRADIMAHSEFGKKRISLLEDRDRKIQEILDDDECFRIKDLKINGKDVMDLGVSEGREVGRILRDVFDKVLEGELPNEREELLLYARGLL